MYTYSILPQKTLLATGHWKSTSDSRTGCANGRRSDVMTSLRLTAKVVIDNEARDHVRNHHAVWQLFLLGLHC